MKNILLSIGILLPMLAMGQPRTYPCETSGNELLSKLIGTWQVRASDRTSPGNFESNEGVSVISKGINGCSISESYQGFYKGKDYAIAATLLLTDSMQVQRTYFDSEHARIMLFEGNVDNEGIKLIWYRNKELRRMQVKYELVFSGTNSFAWETHLSADNGTTWQLTHHWKYKRTGAFVVDNEEHQNIASTLTRYHEGLTSGDNNQVLESISSQYIMFNGNYSGEAPNWLAHLFLHGEDLLSWPRWFIAEAGPYTNDFEIISIHTRANAAIIVTRDTGSNKFRQWKDEQTTWLLGKIEGQWKIIGYYLKDISNP